jgi:hypothetical protein
MGVKVLYRLQDNSNGVICRVALESLTETEKKEEEHWPLLAASLVGTKLPFSVMGAFKSNISLDEQGFT